MWAGSFQRVTVHVCAHCRESFERTGGRPYLYCGRACYHASRVGRKATKAAPVERTCKHCGAQFPSKSSAGARVNYCSRWCQALAAAAKSGEAAALSVAEAAYLAGLIDGEGTVQIQDRRRDRPGSTHPSIYLSVAGSYAPMHEWLLRTTGVGTVKKYAMRPESHPVPSRKQVYAWRVQSANAAALLRQTYPYMLEKQERAGLAVRCFEEGYAVLDAVRGH